MAIHDLFSKRQKRLRGEFPDVYQYKKFNQKFRTQVVQIIGDTIGNGFIYLDPDFYSESILRNIYTDIHEILCEEYGVFTLNEDKKDDWSFFRNYILSEKNYERWLDIIELIFKIIDTDVRENDWFFGCTSRSPDEAIADLNYRFKESGIGYQFESGQIIKIDSEYIHSEAIKPVLYLLGNNEEYAGVNEEFLSAHEHYRHQQYKECLIDCLKSFESLMKVIHKQHSWSYDHDTARKLINSCLRNNLIPNYLQSQFSSLAALLESGIATIRNKKAAHGQGAEITPVPEHLARYALNLTATNLLFLSDCEKKLELKSD